MFTFQLLTPGEGDFSCKASLLTFDNDIKILADPNWNGKNHDDILFMEQYLREVNYILLSHTTPEFISGYVLLCVKFPSLMMNIPVYATVPVNQLGRVSTVEYYRSTGILGPLDSAILEINDVDEYFDRIVSLKYLQSLSLMDNRIVITPYNAGHTLGGTFWLITKRLEKIIYAPSWNHSKDSFLNSAGFLSNGTPISQLMRPTALITNTDLGSNVSHKRRTDKLLALVDATLANGGAVLLPTSLSGRFLELLHLIDQHLQSAPIPVYFLSYSGTKVLSYASNLLEWMSSQLVKEWEEASSLSNNPSNKNNFPFDPSKVDLLLDPSELVQLSGPKIVFCSGIELNNGDMSSNALQYLCQDEKTTIILTEKSQFGYDNSINSQLYRDWYELSTKKNGEAEDGIAVPLEKAISLENWTKEEPLVGTELTDFQEKISNHRKKKLLAKVRDLKNQNLLNADTINGEDSSDDGESDNEPEEKLEELEQSINVPSSKTVDELNEAIITDNVKQALDENIPLDIKLNPKLKPRQAMFPFNATAHKQKFDDYGEVIDINDFQKVDDSANNKLILESKRKLDEKKKWSNVEGKNKSKDKNQKNQVNKLTPQETLNNQILEKNLDTLFSPKKRVPLAAASAFAQGQQLRVRCGLSFVDLSGIVDLRSLSIIVSSLRPYNLLLLPDFTAGPNTPKELNGLKLVEGNFSKQDSQQQDQNNNSSVAKNMSFATIRSGFGSYGSGSASKMTITPVNVNSIVKIGGDGATGGLSDFEIKLDDTIVESLKWQKLDGSHRIAQVYGELEIQNPHNTKRQKTIDGYINSSTLFTLKSTSADKIPASASTNTPKLAIGNIRLPELKKKLINKNLNAEFKGEGILVVNDSVAIRKITYGTIEGDDTGDIVIDGSMGPLYYEIKDCIREMLAYV